VKTYTFPQGGLEYSDPAAPARTSSRIAFLPAISVIPFIQHRGDAADPVVSVGDQVREGMLLGRGRGAGQANVHATVPGRIIRTVSWNMSDGRRTDALVIRLEGSFEKLGRREERFPWEGLSVHDLQRVITEKGVVEMDDAGRPIAEMLQAARSTDTEKTVVIRCVFDDPWLAADYVLCRDRAEAVVGGAGIVLKAAGAKKALLAISRAETALAAALGSVAVSQGLAIDVVSVSNRYPQRNGRELELVLRGYEKKGNAHLGELIFFGPASLAAVYDAVQLNKPPLERYIAVGGSAVKDPQVLRVRIGTRIGDVFAECGGFIDEPKRIGTGSPLSGKTVSDLDEPITKTTFAVFALTESQIGGTVIQDCINCGECRAVCPVGLDPERLYKMAISGKDAEAMAERAAACHGCACCELVCPSRLPLSTAIQTMAIRGGGERG